ncbi:MAG TPA: multidrug ABC transporter [Lachnospiraceae bacterium]|jgi:drug/metabolite transporter (DMT)-like permease|nr:multidrug ABC transporter [Lachnospiraceae bacterium]
MQSSGISPWILLIALSATVASFAQVLLKKSAMEPHANVIKEYLNWKVVFGYLLMFAGMFLTIIAYAKGVQYKNGPIMESIGNIWVVILSFIFFREPVTKKKVIGNLLILAGIAVFYLNWSKLLPVLSFMDTDWGTIFGSLAG